MDNIMAKGTGFSTKGYESKKHLGDIAQTIKKRCKQGYYLNGLSDSKD